MNRMSIHFKPNGPVKSIRMVSQFAGLPLFQVYAFFVDGLLIDTGFAHGRERFLKLCDQLRPTIVINTHHHEDHTGNNFVMAKNYGLIPFAHPKTSSYLKAPSQWMRFYRRVLWGTPEPSETAPVAPEIRTPRFHFVVILTPGHSDDHICIHEPNEGWLFTGDLFVSEQIKYLREDEDIYSAIDSLKRIANLPLKKMFCSFRGVIDGPKDALHRKVDYLENLRVEVEKGLQEGLSPKEIRRKLLGGGDRYRYVTAGQISKQNLIDSFLRKSSCQARQEK
jgi:glyoxylase-like metal-dependent hydrolase (beta-lactamase superfamily II)